MPIQLVYPLKLRFWNHWQGWVALVYLHPLQPTQPVQLGFPVALNILAILIVRSSFYHGALLVPTTLLVAQRDTLKLAIFVEIGYVLLLGVLCPHSILRISFLNHGRLPMLVLILQIWYSDSLLWRAPGYVDQVVLLLLDWQHPELIHWWVHHRWSLVVPEPLLAVIDSLSTFLIASLMK